VRARLWAAGLAAWLGACSTPAPADHQLDFGLPPSPATPEPRLAGLFAQVQVLAPSWLEGTAIDYRLAYETPGELHGYALNHWVAPPAVLLAQRVQQRLAGAMERAPPGLADLQLRVDLEEFTQVFDDPQSSHVALQARASLLDRRQRVLLATRRFDLQRPAPQASAAGAAAGLREAADDFARELLAWARTAVPAAPQ
jgi:cholesterol transport system auxiliary component